MFIKAVNFMMTKVIHKDKKDTTFGLIKYFSLRPISFLSLTLISGAILMLAVLNTQRFRVGEPHFQLPNSSAFKNIVQCSDIGDGIECLRKYRVDLIKDAGLALSPLTQRHVETYVV